VLYGSFFLLVVCVVMFSPLGEVCEVESEKEKEAYPMLWYERGLFQTVVLPATFPFCSSLFFQGFSIKGKTKGKRKKKKKEQRGALLCSEGLLLSRQTNKNTKKKKRNNQP